MTQGMRISLEEIYDYFVDYNLDMRTQYLDLHGKLEIEAVDPFISVTGIQVSISRTFKENSHTKVITKCMLISIPYDDLVCSDCFVTFLDEKMNSALTKLRNEVK